MYHHFFFDMDGTLSESRTRQSEEMREALANLKKAGKDVIVVSGARDSQIAKQIEDIRKYCALSLNGNIAISPSGETLWERNLSLDQKNEVHKHIGLIQKDFPHEVSDPSDLIEDRGAQIAYSLIGHNENLEKKKEFDPGGVRRTQILGALPFESENGMIVRIGGTTNLDYIPEDGTKGHNIRRLVDIMGWKMEQAIYVGDALFPGGNDESVIGVCETKQVNNPEETLRFIQGQLG